jgi:choline dehydrogenase-like flavoprotein
VTAGSVPASTRILIVGSGVAGATIAEGLLGRGLGPVVMLEAGARVPMRRYRQWLDFLTTGRAPYDSCRDPATDTFLHDSRLIARGGSTLHWGGWSLRLQPEDFVLRTNSGVGSDWPIPAPELDPWYGRAEQLLGVATGLPFTQLDGELIRGFEQCGYGYGPMPVARNVAPRDDAPACQAIGTCKYCPIGGRYTADIALDQLEARPDFQLRTGVVATRVRFDRGRAVGVEFRDTAAGETGRLDAEVIVLCAGTLESTKLLLASGAPDAGGHLGRHLFYHPLLYAKGRAARNPRRIQAELDFPTLCSRHFDTRAEQRDGKLFLFLPPTGSRLDLAASMSTGMSNAALDGQVTRNLSIELHGFMELPPSAESAVAMAPGTDAFGLPRTSARFRAPDSARAQIARHHERMRDVLSAAGFDDLRTGVLPARADHASGTCRMSASPVDGVVDPELRLHGTANLHVCSNAVFPSGGAVNPTLTLTALAMRCAERLAVPG